MNAREIRTQNSKYYLAIFICLVTFVVYLPALQNDFVGWDDSVYVSENPFIKSFDLTFFKWAFFDFYASNWHPLTWISHALDYAVWGLDPMGHHLTNNILHAVNTFLVVVLVVKLIEAGRKLTNNKISPNPSFPKRGPSAPPPLEKGDRGGFSDNSVLITAATTGLLFGLHPLHVESVAWIAERKDLLCALFYLLSVLEYLTYRSHKTYKTYFLSLFFFTLALLSKPMAVSLPFVLLILDWYPFSRITSYKTFGRAFVGKLPFIALSIGSAILTMLAQEKAMGLTEYVPLWARSLVAAKALLAYFWKMVVPFNLVPFYQYPGPLDIRSLEYILPVIIVAGITVTCILIAGKQKLWLAVWGYYVLTLAPVLGIIQVGSQSMADRYTYLPSLGPFVIAGLFVTRVYRKSAISNKWGLSIKLVFSCSAVSLFIFLAYSTFTQIGIWNNALGLWNYVIQKEPEKIPFAFYNRGVAYYKAGQMDKALEEYNRTIALDPSYSKAYANRGFIFGKLGRTDKAIADYNKAIALNSLYFEAYNNRGAIFEKTGELKKAAADYEKAVALNPPDSEAYNNLGVVFEKMGKLEKAIANYDKAVALNPSNSDAYFNRGNTYDEMGQPDKAIEDYNKAIALKPGDSQAYNNRGVVFEKTGDLDKAIADYEKAAALDPSNSEALNNRRAALEKKSSGPAKQGRPAKAFRDAVH